MVSEAVSPQISLNPLIAHFRSYPFARLSEAKNLYLASPQSGAQSLIEFGTGEPRERTPEFIHRALLDAASAEQVSSYPLAVGLAELRESVAGWIGRRFGCELDPSRHVLPTLGSKELVYGLAQAVVDLDGGRDLIAVPEPAYPVYERGARFAGARTLMMPLKPENGFLPDLSAITVEQWERLALLWVNYPNNPTAATASTEWYRDAASLCRKHGVLLASDEAYSELWFEGEAPDSAFSIGSSGDELENVVVINSLSKRSSMPGYRSGFVAGDARVIAALKQLRPSVGVAPQRFVQLAAVAAWEDETHVEEVREVYRSKLQAIQPGLDALGLRNAGGSASFFRWLQVPDAWNESEWAKKTTGGPLFRQIADVLDPGNTHSAQGSSAALAAALFANGLMLAPGSFFGASGEGYVRLALVPTLEDCKQAAKRMISLV